MRKLFVASLLSVALAGSAAVAGDFDRTSTVLKFTNETVTLKFSGTEDGLDATFLDVKVYEGNNFGLKDKLSLGVAYIDQSYDTLVTAEYTVSGQALGGNTDASVWVAYAPDAKNFAEWTIVPKIEQTYALSAKTDVFGSLSYVFDGDQGNLDGRGGFAEIGLDYNLNDNVALRGSLVQGFDRKDLTDVNAKIELVTQF